MMVAVIEGFDGFYSCFILGALHFKVDFSS